MRRIIISIGINVFNDENEKTIYSSDGFFGTYFLHNVALFNAV